MFATDEVATSHERHQTNGNLPVLILFGFFAAVTLVIAGLSLDVIRHHEARIFVVIVVGAPLAVGVIALERSLTNDSLAPTTQTEASQIPARQQEQHRSVFWFAGIAYAIIAPAMIVEFAIRGSQWSPRFVMTGSRDGALVAFLLTSCVGFISRLAARRHPATILSRAVAVAVVIGAAFLIAKLIGASFELVIFAIACVIAVAAERLTLRVQNAE